MTYRTYIWQCMFSLWSPFSLVVRCRGFTWDRPAGARPHWADNVNWFLMKTINLIRSYSIEFHFQMGLKWLCKIILRPKWLWVWTGFRQPVTRWGTSHSFLGRVRKTDSLPWPAHPEPQNCTSATLYRSYVTETLLTESFCNRKLST